MTSKPLKILLVEDDELFRLGLRVRLQQEAGLEIVAEANDGETAIELVEACAIDVVLLDVGLPGIGGIETCCQLQQRYPQIPVLVLTSHFQPALIARLIAAGAQGYCVKGIAAETLILALQSVAAGASWWDAPATQTIQSGLKQVALSESESLNEARGLTQREQEVLALIATGKSNSEIAQALYITPGTVRVHVHAILHKLGVRDRTQAVIIALQNRWITPGSGS
ncbi:MAG: response regulator transcription factor [Prochlorothrix sp.]|nr:response regulator transcription factor [Prochlorothrix sp.]